jgi:hypothetical protein
VLVTKDDAAAAIDMPAKDGVSDRVSWPGG